MKKKLVIFVGNVLKSNLDIFIKEGYEIGFIKDIHNNYDTESYREHILPNLGFIIPCNFSSFASIEKSLKDFHFHKETILISGLDRYFFALSKIAQLFELDQNKDVDLKAAQQLTNKFYQRKLFNQNYPEITPPFKKIRTFHGAYTFSRKHGFPIIVKPANLSQGQLVHICNDLEELIKNVSYVLDHVRSVYNTNLVRRKPQVIIEKFIEGKQYSVDSYIDQKGKICHTPVCKQVISHDLGFDDFQTYYSGFDSGLSAEDEQKALDAVTKALKSLNIQATPTHTEVKITPAGEAQIIEVNVRAGGFRAQLLDQSYQIDHVKNIINCYTGGDIDINRKLIKHSAAPQFWADQEGILVDVLGEEEFSKLPSFVSFNRYQIGNKVGPVNKGYKRVGCAILAHVDPKVLQEDLVKIRSMIKIKLEDVK